MRKYVLPFLASLLLFVQVKVWSQHFVNVHDQLKFRHITVDNGLTNNRINSICQDQYGYTWIATYFGLNRYDGLKNSLYYHKIDDSLTLPSNTIWKVFCDSAGKIWIGTTDGLCYYNEFNDRFVRFPINALPSQYNDIYDITEDENRQMWFATLGGLYSYKPESGTLACYNRSGNDQMLTLPSDSVYRILKDGRNKFWLSLFDMGICWIDMELGIVKHFMNIPGDIKSLSDNRVESILKDSHGNLWLGTLNGGLNLLNNADSTFTRYTLDKNDIYSNRVRVLFEDPQGKLFCGTRAGLYKYDQDHKNFNLYANMTHKFSRLSANSILCSYLDTKGGLWLGTHYGGVNYSNFLYSPFITHFAKDNDHNFLNNPSVFTMQEDSKGDIYICTEKGINILRQNTSTFEYIVHDPVNENSLSYDDVKSIALDSKDNLWIGTNNGGLDYYNRSKDRFIHYKHNPDDPTSLPSNKIYFVLLDQDENLWILMNENWNSIPSILSVLKHNETKFKTYYNEFYGDIIKGSNGNLYIGGVNGVWIHNKETGNMIYYASQQIFHVMALHEDVFGNLWIGSETGLSRFDPRTKQCIHFTHIADHFLQYVFGILSDDNYNLWVSTNAGLIKIINAVRSTDSLSIRLYNKDDGLPSKEFMYNAFFQSKQGEMFFGTNNGLVRFFPDQIKEDRFEPNIVISELLFGDDLIMPGDKVNRRIVLSQPIQKTRSITIDYKTKVFTLKFNALHYANPEKNMFKYKLENFDHGWKYTNAYNNTVTYTSLPKGKYTFCIYASNNNGVYCSTPLLLEIRILPPFWQTWIFRITFILFTLATAVFIFRMRLRKVKSQKEMLEEIVQERTVELNKSYIDLQEQKNEILTQNEEIQAQNEEMQNQREYIDRNNALLEASNRNLQLLNEFGRQLTATLDKSGIDQRIQKYIQSQLKINIFGLGIYNQEKEGITFTDFTEDGTKISDFTSKLDDTTSMGVYCFKRNETIFCNDFKNEYKNYITRLHIRSARIPQSVIYVPLVIGNKKIGIFTLQSYEKNAFSGQIIPVIESMASYIAIALDNANVYEIVRDQNEKLEKKKEFLEDLVKERTRDLEKAKNKAEESDRLKSAFLSNMSHEIRTPLNAIIGFIELLDGSNNTPEEIESFHQIIKSSGFTLLQLINDIIDFSKMESGQLEFFISDVKLNDLLSEIYKTFNEEIRKNKALNQLSVQLNLRMIHDKQIVVKTDTVRLQQIFNNLIGNAIKFTKEGFIEFGIKEIIPEREIVFFVKDTGIGIEKKHLQKIFSRFVKIDDNKTTLYRGTGLGLTITKHLVETMGGEIHVESEPGKGSEFSFSLPYEGSQDDVSYADGKMVKTDEVIPDWSNKHFLIVEDEESNYQVINSLLRRTGVKTTWARDGQESITIYQQHKDNINLVLLDIKMPKMDGFQVIRALKKLNPSVPVIAQTAYALANEEYMIYKAGFDGYLVKPITLHSLIQIISRHISS